MKRIYITRTLAYNRATGNIFSEASVWLLDSIEEAYGKAVMRLNETHPTPEWSAHNVIGGVVDDDVVELAYRELLAERVRRDLGLDE